MSSQERRLREVQAYHDGELSRLGRWRMRRRLERDPQVRQQLESLAAMAELLREADAEVDGPDLWEDIRLRLPALDAHRKQSRSPAPRWVPSPGWLGAGLAAAAAALALAVALDLPRSGDPGSVRWIDARGKQVLVLEDGWRATIVWVTDGPTVRDAGGRGDVAF